MQQHVRQAGLLRAIISFLPTIMHGCIRAHVMFLWGGHIVDWKWD
jgi:hypothetical protein